MRIPDDRIREIEAASTPTNAEFVPMAQTAISELLAEREERIAELGVMLREIERLKKHTVSCSIYEELYTRAEKAEADNERLEGEIKDGDDWRKRADETFEEDACYVERWECHSPECKVPCRVQLTTSDMGLPEHLKTKSRFHQRCLTKQFAEAVPVQDWHRLSNGNTTEKAEADNERLREKERFLQRFIRLMAENLQHQYDEHRAESLEKALEAVREWTDDPPATLGNTVYLACQAMVRAILDGEVE